MIILTKDKCHQMYLFGCVRVAFTENHSNRAHLYNLPESRNWTYSANIEGLPHGPLHLRYPMKALEEYCLGFTFLNIWNILVH